MYFAEMKPIVWKDMVATVEASISDVVVLVKRQGIIQLQRTVYHLVGAIPHDASVQHCAIELRPIVVCGLTLLRLEKEPAAAVV